MRFLFQPVYRLEISRSSISEAEYRVKDPFIMEEFGLLFQMFFCICFKSYGQSRSQNMGQKEGADYAAAKSGAVR